MSEQTFRDREWWIDRVDELQKQRDELLAACKSARSAITFGGKIDWNVINDQLCAAIAKAEGSPQATQEERAQ